MTTTKDNISRAELKNDLSSPTAATPKASHVLHDERGNAVWRWDKDNDPSSTASTSKMLKKLDIADLWLEDSAASGKPPEAAKKGSGYGPGYNPYDRTAPVRVALRKPSR